MRGGEILESDFVLITTGSSPVGHKLVENLGHSITDLSPSLFTFEIQNELLEDNSGVSFQNAFLQLKLDGKKKKLSFTGPLLITHWGLSGPAVLKLSAFAARELHKLAYKAKLFVTWDSDLTESSALEQITSFKKEKLKKIISKNPALNFPKRFWSSLVMAAKIPENKI